MNADREGPRAPIWTLRLFGLADARLDLTLTLLALAVLAASRFLLLANGPWEQDEAIFGRSVLAFDPAHHAPHAPFFPGWIWLGMALTPLAGDPLRAFQILSAIASILCVFPLAFLGRRVAPAPVAAACALAVEFLPGSWLFSVRGFNSIAAALFLFVALAWLARGISQRDLVPVALFLAASFLIRPVLAPVQAVIWAAVAWRVRAWRPLAKASGVMLVAVIVGTYPVVRALGGWGAYVSRSLSHYEGHVVSVAAASWRLADLGPVNALGGPAAAVTLGLLCLVGIAVWWRREGRGAGALALVLAGGFVAYLLFVHVRTFPRYSAPLALGIAPLLAGALALIPWPALGAGVALGAAAWSGVAWHPALAEQHRDPLPMWRAASMASERSFAEPGTWQVLGDLDSWIFVTYADVLLRSRHPELTVPAPEKWALPMNKDPLAPHWLVVTGQDLAPIPFDGSREEVSAAGVSDGLRPLTQGRFLHARVISDPPLERGRWWPLEIRGDGTSFTWCSTKASVFLPGVGPRAFLELKVKPAVGAKPLVVGANRKFREVVPGDDKEAVVQIPAEALFGDKPNRVFLDREAAYPPGGADTRPLSTRVFGVTAGRYGAIDSDFGDLPLLGSVGVAIQGFYGKETFRDGVIGRWSEPKAWIDMPATAPAVVLTLLAPRPSEANVEVFLDGVRIAGPWLVPTTPKTFTLTLPESATRAGKVRLELRTSPYATPALPKRPSRSLGVVVSHIAVPLTR